MPANHELLEMPAVGACIDIVGRHWRTTIVRRCPEYGAYFREMYPVRVDYDCALDDVQLCMQEAHRFFTAPHSGQYFRSVCAYRCKPISYWKAERATAWAQ